MVSCFFSDRKIPGEAVTQHCTDEKGGNVQPEKMLSDDAGVGIEKNNDKYQTGDTTDGSCRDKGLKVAANIEVLEER